MKRAKNFLREILSNITPEERAEARLSCQISNRLDLFMKEKGLSKKQLADAIGKRPIEITRLLSGEHNFSISPSRCSLPFSNSELLKWASTFNKKNV